MHTPANLMSTALAILLGLLIATVCDSDGLPTRNQHFLNRVKRRAETVSPGEHLSGPHHSVKKSGPAASELVDDTEVESDGATPQEVTHDETHAETDGAKHPTKSLPSHAAVSADHKETTDKVDKSNHKETTDKVDKSNTKVINVPNTEMIQPKDEYSSEEPTQYIDEYGGVDDVEPIRPLTKAEYKYWLQEMERAEEQEEEEEAEGTKSSSAAVINKSVKTVPVVHASDDTENAKKKSTKIKRLKRDLIKMGSESSMAKSARRRKKRDGYMDANEMNQLQDYLERYGDGYYDGPVEQPLENRYGEFRKRLAPPPEDEEVVFDPLMSAGAEEEAEGSALDYALDQLDLPELLQLEAKVEKRIILTKAMALVETEQSVPPQYEVSRRKREYGYGYEPEDNYLDELRKRAYNYYYEKK